MKRLNESNGGQVAAGLALASVPGRAGAELCALVQEARERDESTEEQALLSVLRTKKGAELWEQGRRAQLSESATLAHWTQDRR
jgi:hypothetical protein